ncbi:hypothetical protein ACFX2I_019720 [Malus domestica]
MVILHFQAQHISRTHTLTRRSSLPSSTAQFHHHHGSRPHKDSEEIFPLGDRALLLAHDPRLSHQQEDPRGSRHHPLQVSLQQDCRILHPPHEADPEEPGLWHFPEAAGGGPQAPHGLCPQGVRHQDRRDLRRQGDPRHALRSRYGDMPGSSGSTRKLRLKFA